MKKTTKKASPARKLLPAAASLLISAAMLSTSTFAWFTMNKEVTVTGMQLMTKVGSNLLVCANNVEASYTDDLSQTRSALLEPVSTVNAYDEKFFYTINAAADGHWLEGAGSMKNYSEAAGDPATNTNTTATAIGKSYFDATFNSTYGITPAATTQFDTAYGYVDYVFYLKATSDADNSAINLTECNLIYDNDVLGSGDNAWRVAFFVKDITANGGDGTVSQDLTSTTANATTSNLISILDIDGASSNWTADNAVTNTTGTLGSVSNAGSAVTWGDIDAGATAYYKVVARVWLEGEDQSCKSSTYAALMDGTWELGLQFELNQGTAVGTIASATNNDTGAIMAPTTP
jgi:hypothetical protein